MTSPHKKASPGGCFSGIARTLLCKGSLQTHPSDQLTDFLNKNKTDHHQFKPSKTNMKNNIEANVVQATTGPGVVARLMGLESLPETNWVPKGRSPDSVPRSRSVNYMDYFHELDLEQAQHRRVRTSVSFREVPTALNQENNEFYVVYLDNLEKRREQHGLKLRKSEFGIGDLKQKNEVKNQNYERAVKKYEKKQVNYNKISNTRDKPRRVLDKNVSNYKRSGRISSPDNKKEVRRRKSRENSNSKKPVNDPTNSINRKEELAESKLMKKIKNQQAVRDTRSDCSSEDSSPASVLSLGDFSVDEQTPLLPDYPRPVDSCSMKNDEQFETDQNWSYYIELVTKFCRLTEKELKMSNWIVRNSALEFEFCKEMCMELEQQILDALLLQIVEELGE